MQQQKLCLKWNNHTANLLEVLGTFRQTDILVDVTISCEGRNIKAHKMVLSACSPYFQNIFLENPCQHPIVIINGMKYEDVTAILNFMYKGEVNVSHDGLSSFLQAAEALKVRGLAEVCGDKNSASQESEQPEQSQPQRAETPNKKRHRNRKRSLSDSNKSDDEGAVPRKQKDINSPEVHDLSGDEAFTGDTMSSNGQLNSRLRQNTMYSRSHQSSNVIVEEMEDEYEVEPTKLLEQTLTENVSMNNSTSSDNLRIEQIMGNATEMESSSLQEPESPPDIKPIIEYGESSSGPSEGNILPYNEQSQPGPSSVQDSSLLHDNSHTQGAIKIITSKLPTTQSLKLKNILFPVSFTGTNQLPQLFLIKSNVFGQQQKQQQQPPVQQPQPSIDLVLPEKPAAQTTIIKPEPLDEENLELTVFDGKPPPDIISIDTPLPDFSPTVKHHLSQNDLSAVWGSFIDECAKHYFSNFPNIQNSSEYQTIGRKMYAFYPTIAFDGKEPWSFFCKCLSQKIRHIKWKLKQKKMGIKPNTQRRNREGFSYKFRSLRRKIDHRYTPSKLYKALLKELMEGWKSDKISEYRIIEIIRQTNKGRRTWLETHPKRKISSLVAEYPCFLKATYLIEDFLCTVSQDDTHLMTKRFESLFTAVGAVMKPPVESKSFLQQKQILKYLEDETAFDSSRRSPFKSVFVHHENIPQDKHADFLDTAEDAYPLLFIFSSDGNIDNMYIAGDKTIIEVGTTNIFDGLLTLLAVYYTCCLEYPKHNSQILGLFQMYIVGESFDGLKSIKFKQFMKTLNNHFDILK